ncbi:MAG: hypothetical protein V1686_00740 [Patescibacteria group bacterium]
MNKFEKPNLKPEKLKIENLEKEMTSEREEEIDELIDKMPDKEDMTTQETIEWIASFAPYKGNEDIIDATFLQEIAERIKISLEETNRYAMKKATDVLREIKLKKQKRCKK